MSTIGVHSFQIPHEHIQPMRDMIIVRLPMPPKQSKGGIITPDTTRDLMQHNVMAGKIFAVGPLAFTYRESGDDLKHQEAKIGDWVIFRPYAGTMIQGGRLTLTSGWRYLSSFNDVIGIVSADVWDPQCEWDYADLPGLTDARADFNFSSAREAMQS